MTRPLARCALLFVLAGCATTQQASVSSPTLAAKDAPPAAAAPPEAPVEPRSDAVPAAFEPAVADAPAPGLPKVPDLEAQAHHQQGIAALAKKDGPLAAAHLGACARKAPSDVACHWERGWAHFLLGDWAQVVNSWERVWALQPDHPEVEGQLRSARAQLELRHKLAEAARAAPQAVRPAPPEGATVRLRAVGDVMLGTVFPEGYLAPDDGAKLLEGVKPLLQDADLTFVNLEGPLCDDPAPSRKCGKKSKPGSCYAFKSPRHYGKYLKDAGVDLASTANNHSGDFGEICRRQTEAELDALGIAWSGAPGTVASVERNGLRIAMIAFHTSPATNDVNDHATAAALVQAAAGRHDLVVVSFHGGAEGKDALHVKHGREVFYGENRGDLPAFARAVVDAGADLVLGHGPHVPRAMELYRDRLVVYSMGNFATYGRFSLSGPNGVGMVVEVTLGADGRFVAGKVLPTRQVGEGVPVVDERREAIDYVRMLSREDFPESGVQLDAEGNILPPGGGTAQRGE